MHLHILGICGTFMGGLALIARAAGHRVTGCDAGVYPPMSTQLAEQGIELIEGFGPEQISLKPDLFVIGNVVSRGNPLMEAILESGLPYTSGPQWLGDLAKFDPLACPQLTRHFFQCGGRPVILGGESCSGAVKQPRCRRR